MFKEHLHIKKIFSMAFTDLKKVYRGAALGWLWLIIKPTVVIFVYWFMFEIGLRISNPVNGYPYFLWLVAGMLPWMYISEMISDAPAVYKKYNYLVTKIKFPVSTVPTFVSISKIIVSFMLSLVFLTIYFIVTRQLDMYLLQIPLYLFLMVLGFSPLMGIFALISSVSKDIGNLIKTLPTPLLMLSPIFYDTNNISVIWIKNIQLYNPINYCVNGFRNVFINKKWFFEEPLELLVYFLIILLLNIVFAYLYKKLKKDMPDYL